VGAGYWGSNLIRNFANLPGAELVAVCDVDPGRLQRLTDGFDIRTTASVKDIADDRRIDAVVIATPAETHFAVAQPCLEAGKHVLVEKPMATNAQQAMTMIDLAAKNQRILMVGHIFMYDQAILKLIEMVQNHSVGQIRYLHSIRTGMGGTARLDTSIVWDSLVHDAYIIPAMLGRPPARVLATGAAYLTPGLEDVVFAIFDFGEGILAQCYASWYALEKVRRCTVVGSHAVIAYDDLTRDRLVLYARRYEQSEELDAQGRARWRWIDEGPQRIEVPNLEPLRMECEHFVECIASGKPPRTDGRSGLEAVRILEACTSSLRNGNGWESVG
jgi:predicted dehydrogenase